MKEIIKDEVNKAIADFRDRYGIKNLWELELDIKGTGDFTGEYRFQGTITPRGILNEEIIDYVLTIDGYYDEEEEKIKIDANVVGYLDDIQLGERYFYYNGRDWYEDGIRKSNAIGL